MNAGAVQRGVRAVLGGLEINLVSSLCVLLSLHRRYSDGTDYFVMALGALGAVANGAAMPMFSILFGGL